MLLDFSVKNWMSFKDETSLSLIASRERQHGERIAFSRKYRIRVLPSAMIYGRNASGKSSFFRALEFVRHFVLRGTKTEKNLIHVRPFRLDKDSRQVPSRFVITLLLQSDQGENIYEYSFSVRDIRVYEEKLVQVFRTTEKVIYDRQEDDIHFGNGVDADAFLKYAAEGTKPNQLFLTNVISQNTKGRLKLNALVDVYNWFADSLILIAPNAEFANWGKFFDHAGPFSHKMNQFLSHLDTGVSALTGEIVDMEQFPDQLKMKLNDLVTNEDSVGMSSPNQEKFFASRDDNGQLLIQQMVAQHDRQDGGQVNFGMRDESDGTRRLIDLLPAFIRLREKNSDVVCFIDELDRSLHTLLTRALVEYFLDQPGEQRKSQLIFTTHDIGLMDQKLFRRDEMWIVEKIQEESQLVSFNDYQDTRYDKDVRKSYLDGRMGGIPRINLHVLQNL